MADFQEQAMGLTGLTIDASSTAPSRAEFSTFLNDGVIDVTQRHLRRKPSDDHLFLAVSGEQTSQGLDLNGAKITSVVRESGTDNDWRECSKIHPSKQGQAVASGSIHLATTHNPVYTILDNGGISVFPAPGSDPNAFKVYYVNNSPAETDGTALDHASTGIKFFPKDKIYLVILYASIKSLQNSLSDIDISTFSSSTTIPVSPSINTVAYTDATNADASASGVDTVNAFAPSIIDVSSNAPSYTPPVVTGDTQEITGTIVAGAIGTTGDFLNFQHWYDVLADMIETEEDTELAQLQLQKIQSYITAYQAAMQNQLNEFNEGNARYQMEFQEAVTKSNQDLQAAIANANTEAQKKRQEAQLTTDINKFNKQQDQALNLSNAAKQMEKLVQDNNNKLQKFQSELGVYQAEVNKEVTVYQQEISEKTTEYQWKVGRMQELKQEYNQAFISAQQTK